VAEDLKERPEQIVKHRAMLRNDQDIGRHSGNEFDVGAKRFIASRFTPYFRL
jgi:hypothetical protein